MRATAEGWVVCLCLVAVLGGGCAPQSRPVGQASPERVAREAELFRLLAYAVEQGAPEKPVVVASGIVGLCEMLQHLSPGVQSSITRDHYVSVLWWYATTCFPVAPPAGVETYCLAQGNSPLPGIETATREARIREYIQVCVPPVVVSQSTRPAPQPSTTRSGWEVALDILRALRPSYGPSSSQEPTFQPIPIPQPPPLPYQQMRECESQRTPWGTVVTRCQ